MTGAHRLNNLLPFSSFHVSGRLTRCIQRHPLRYLVQMAHSGVSNELCPYQIQSASYRRRGPTSISVTLRK